MMNLDLTGNIEQFTLPEILQLIAAGRKSGTLGITREDQIIMIYFDRGDIIYGYGPGQAFHLGQMLQERGAISPENLAEAVRIQTKTENSKRLGEILISRRFIDRVDLEAVVKSQIETLLYSILSWQEGAFKFYEGKYPTEEEITVRLSVENVILEGLRRIDEANMVRQTLPDLDTVYTISASQAGRTRDVALKANEWNVMALVDGHRSIEQICKTSRVDRNETLTRLAQLKLAGIITKTDATAARATDDLDRMIERLAGLFESYLTAKSAPPTGDRKITRTYFEEAK
jgi:hypothetical protein